MALSLRAMLQKFLRDGWAETTSADNLLSTATHAAGGIGTKHAVKSISVGYSVAPVGSKLWQVKVGSTVKAEGFIDTLQGVERIFPGGIVAADNESVSVELEASGVGGQLGITNIHGVTE